MSNVQFGGQVSPFLNSYSGLSGNQLVSLADQQNSYHPQAPQANVQAAEQFISAAMEAKDPALRDALLQKALEALTPGGTSSGSGASPASSVPASNGGAAPTGGSASPAGGGSAPSATGTAGASATPADGLSVNGNSIDTGRYLIQPSKTDDGSLSVTDKTTGKSFEVWGDPHVKENGQDVADFQKGNLNIQLQDGTVLHLQPGALNNGVSHLDQVAVTKGDQAVTIGGTNGSFANGVTTSGVMNGEGAYQSSLYNTPDATNITYGADDMLHYNNANGSMGDAITATNGHETDLDGKGGGLVGQGSSSASPVATGSAAASSSGNEQQLIDQLMSTIQQYVGGFDANYMQNMLQSMENQSGFQTV